MSTRRDCLALSPSWDARSLSTKSGFFSSASRRLSCCSTAIGRDAPQESLLLRGYVPRSPLGSSRFPPVLSPINLVPTRFDAFAFRDISDHCLCVRRRPGKLVSKEKTEGDQWALDIQIIFHIIEKPQLIHFAQINFGGVFEDKAADILLMDQVAVAVLLRASCRASEFSLQMAALDPAGYCMGIDPQRLRKAVAGVEAPVILEPHSFQLEVDSSYRACISGRFQLEADAFIAHPCVAGENLPFPLAPRQLFRAGKTQFTGTLFQSPMRHADFLCQRPDARARLRLRRAEVDFSDEMVDLVAEHVLAAALGFTSATIVAADCGRTNRSSFVYA